MAETFPFESGAPAVAVLNGEGDFAVAWESFEGVGDPQGFGLLLNVFDSTGYPYLAEPIVVNESIEGDQAAPVVASDGTGQFLVSWQSKTAANNQDVLGRWYQLDAGQLTAGDEFAIASSPANELAPAVSMQGGAASIV